MHVFKKKSSSVVFSKCILLFSKIFEMKIQKQSKVSELVRQKKKKKRSDKNDIHAGNQRLDNVHITFLTFE